MANFLSIDRLIDRRTSARPHYLSSDGSGVDHARELWPPLFAKRSRIVSASDVALRQPGKRLIKTILSYRYATNMEFRVREIEKEIT